MRRQQVNVRTCRFCGRRFSRTEHLSRHERTHTNEKPFHCVCGKTFSRQDLLSRHLRSPHDPWRQHGQTETAQIARPNNASAQVLNRAANSSPVASARNAVSMHLGPSIRSYERNVQSDEGPNASDQHEVTVTPNASPLMDYGADIDLLLGCSDLALPASYDQFDALLRPNYAPASEPEILDPPLPTVSGLPSPIEPENHAGENTNREGIEMLSSYSSRLPSLEPADGQPLKETNPNHKRSNDRLGMCIDTRPSRSRPRWRVTPSDYASISGAIQGEHNHLPVGFALPSRHAIDRYLEGYFTGFHDHLPFIHIPTMSLTNIPLTLLLAMVAIGAQYRFEREVALRLYCASKALAHCQARMRFHRPRNFTSLNQSQQANQLVSARISRESEGNRTIEQEEQDSGNLELIQALVNLMIFATYNHNSLLQDAFEIADCLVRSLRESRVLEQGDDAADQSWQQWVATEGRRRTVYGAFIFLHIHSVVYNVPPKVMSSAIQMVPVPLPEDQWRASSADEWQRIRADSLEPGNITLEQSCAAYLGSKNTGLPEKCGISSFGNLVLIHAILQQIYLAWELNSTHLDRDHGACRNEESHSHSHHRLPSSTVSRLENALAQWKRNWETTRESSLDPHSLAFNSTALFRIACIRLHFNIRPHLRLETRDPWLIATAIRAAQFPADRTPNLYRAVLQSAHSVSIPVRLGVEFVARTQTLTWSIVHTLCNVECVVLLSKWLELVASDPRRSDMQEQRLVDMVADIFNEAGLDLDHHTILGGQGDDSKRLRWMSIAIIKLLAHTLKGPHVFELAEILRASLDSYAVILENALR